MNPWEGLLNVLGWFALVLVSILVIVVVSAVLIGAVIGIRKWFPTKQERTKPYPADLPMPTAEQDDYMAEATVVGQSMYTDEVFGVDQSHVEAFRAGARWGWGFFHRP